MIKVTELQIGDWVQNPLGWKAQVQSIRYVNTIKDEWLVKIGINNESFQDHLSLTEIEPIPLTAEILEKNGWMKVEVDGVFYPKQLKGELPWIGYATNGDSWKFRVRDFCEIKYVHQLQNALRLCGIEHEITL